MKHLQLHLSGLKAFGIWSSSNNSSSQHSLLNMQYRQGAQWVETWITVKKSKQSTFKKFITFLGIFLDFSPSIQPTAAQQCTCAAPEEHLQATNSIFGGHPVWTDDDDEEKKLLLPLWLASRLTGLHLSIISCQGDEQASMVPISAAAVMVDAYNELKICADVSRCIATNITKYAKSSMF
jgi:hypothetical protein